MDRLDWPVCPTSETGHPHRMGAALSYARRSALFALVGIAGEDDLDAPDILAEPSPHAAPSGNGLNGRSALNGPTKKPQPFKPVLAPEPSAGAAGDRYPSPSRTGDDLALWPHRRLAAKKYAHGRGRRPR
jgi:hypothetical protein